MTYMPNFAQSAIETQPENQQRLEAKLLRKHSHERLSRLLTLHKLAASNATYQTRLEAELQIIEDYAFCSYFLIVADYVRWAKENEIAVGPGRGSGPCSLVAYVLGVTNIDPIEHNLPFERFINPNRNALPDFDLDFCSERSAEVTNYIQSKYGSDRVAQISSEDTTPLPSRLVICDRPLVELTALYVNPDSGFPVAQMNLAQIKDAGMVQFNVIKQKALTVIQKVIKDIEKSGEVIDINKIALDDVNTYRLLSVGEASHTPVLDSDLYVSTLLAVAPIRFENLCAVIALSQTRLQDHIPLFVERSRNPDSVQYFHPAIEPITAETYGLILFQEQVMHIAHQIAGFSLVQSDLFRRAIIKSSHETMSHYKKLFIAGTCDFGLTRLEAVGLFEHVAIAGQRYSNKSHAVAFAMIAYQAAWLKANYPSEYINASSTKGKLG